MTEPNWAELWRRLTERARRPEGTNKQGTGRPDPLLERVLDKLRPQDTVLDIGAGAGRFAIPFARTVRSVTAIEPSKPMAELLRRSGMTNLRLVEARWEEAEVEPHDVAFCSHAMYSSEDLVAFVRKMEAKARNFCFLVMRVPSHNGVMRELSRRIYGEPHDSPNFWVGYNVLYEMGIYASVAMEPSLRPWTDATLEDALSRARRHLQLEGRSAWDDAIRETLAQRLDFRDGQYYWPDGMRSALVWWRPG